MAYLVLYVLDNISQMPDVLTAWEKAGTSGVTIFDTTGIGRLRQAGFRDDLPLMPSLTDLFMQPDINHKTLMTVVKDEATVDKIVAVTQAVVGDFAQHHTGVLCVMPLTRVYGLEKPPRE